MVSGISLGAKLKTGIPKVAMCIKVWVRPPPKTMQIKNKYMATSKEFNRLFDLIEKETNTIREAHEMAYSLGFSANYCDGINMEDFDYQIKQICKILGVKSRKEWPSSVEESYKDGAHAGYLET